MKEREAEINYIWVCSEIGKIKREIQEKERLLLLLEKNKIIFELKFKDREGRKENDKMLFWCTRSRKKYNISKRI